MPRYKVTYEFGSPNDRDAWQQARDQRPRSFDGPIAVMVETSYFKDVPEPAPAEEPLGIMGGGRPVEALRNDRKPGRADWTPERGHGFKPDLSGSS